MQLNFTQQLSVYTSKGVARLQRSGPYCLEYGLVQRQMSRGEAVHSRGYSSVFRPYTPGVILPFLGRTHQGLFVRFCPLTQQGLFVVFCPQTQQGLNVRFCIQTQQGLTVRFSRLYINSQTNCTYHINKSINLFHFHQNHPFLNPKSHRNS